MKEILIVYYSQTGQLFNVLNNIASTLKDKKINISYYKITPRKSYPFPWKQKDFYNAFPESFLQIPSPLSQLDSEVLQKKYDLIILGYTVWYLTPSIPINSFLKTPEAKQLFQNTPVVTVSASRNMWIMAQEKMKKLLIANSANLVGNIALVDRNINHVSVLTIMHWMFGGKKTRLLGIFPKPGVSESDIENASRFGEPIKQGLLSGNYSTIHEQLLALKAVKIKPLLIATDTRANIIFSKWANHIIKKEGVKREKWLVYFKYYLLFAIWFIAPIVFIVFLVTYLPFYGKIKKEKTYYSSVALKKD